MSGLLFVCLGAVFGAPARYLLDRAVQARHDSVVPWGTIVVNLSGSVILGVFTGIASDTVLPSPATLVVATGFCGTFTTYSTFAYETMRLAENERWLTALANMTVTIAGGLGAAVIGYTVGALV